VFADYGETGISPDEVTLEYHPFRAYTVPSPLDNKLASAWAGLTEENPRLHDGQLLNLLEIDGHGRALEVSQGSFRDYFTLLRSAMPSTTGAVELTERERAFANQQVRPLSSYCLSQTEDAIVLGLKQAKGEYMLDCPGSGFFDAAVDTHESATLNPTAELIRREVVEELGVQKEIDRLRCFGIFGEATGGFLINPALFSTAHLECSAHAVVDRAQDAVDSWEFETVVTMPHPTAGALKSLLAGDLSAVTRSGETSLGPSQSVSFAPKCPLMLALYGRRRFGADWFRSLEVESLLECVPIEE
jgi:hypothetical protein